MQSASPPHLHGINDVNHRPRMPSSSDLKGFVHLCEAIGCTKMATFCENHARNLADLSQNLKHLNEQREHRNLNEQHEHVQLSAIVIPTDDNSSNDNNPMQSLADQSVQLIAKRKRNSENNDNNGDNNNNNTVLNDNFHEAEGEFIIGNNGSTSISGNKTVVAAKSGCLESGCSKRRFAKSEKCVEHSRPDTCIIKKCKKDVTKGLGLCKDHLVKEVDLHHIPIPPRLDIELEELTSDYQNGDGHSHGLETDSHGNTEDASIDDEHCKSTRCKRPRIEDKPYCETHVNKAFCKVLNCSSLAHGKGLCKAHGGTPLCRMEGCTTGARGKSRLCVAHGGGRRCSENECHNGAVTKEGKCRKHGGGKRCAADDCTRAASGATDFCKMHGGGKRCEAESCYKPAHNKNFCYKHFRLAGFEPSLAQLCSADDCKSKCFRDLDTCKLHAKQIPVSELQQVQNQTPLLLDIQTNADTNMKVN